MTEKIEEIISGLEYYNKESPEDARDIDVWACFTDKEVALACRPVIQKIFESRAIEASEECDEPIFVFERVKEEDNQDSLKTYKVEIFFSHFVEGYDEDDARDKACDIDLNQHYDEAEILVEQVDD